MVRFGANGAMSAHLEAGRLARRVAAAELAGDALGAWRLRKRAAVLAEAACQALAPGCSPALRGRFACRAAEYWYATGDWLAAEEVVRRLLCVPALSDKHQEQLREMLRQHPAT
ncbi:MAG: hypothetical protein NTZ05_19240 [Chloroflexi bacterium]|nr:hypothetical protein [Chloroflexota bacterium]